MGEALEIRDQGRMWRVLRSIYKNVESSVLLGCSRTQFFKVDAGLRQGCVLSPLLFNVFINDLRDTINQLDKGVKIGNLCRRIKKI